MTFSEDLKIGKEYEDEIVELFNYLFDKKKFRKVTKEQDPDFYKVLDIIEDVPKRTRRNFTNIVTAECKFSSDKHKDSPNVVVEYATYKDEPSGICTSLATYWVFKAGKFHLIVKREELLKAILNDLICKDSHKQIKRKYIDHKSLLLVPIALLEDKKFCPSTIKHLTKEAFSNKDESICIDGISNI